MILSIESSEEKLIRILAALARNPKNKDKVYELVEIYNFLLAEISQRDMDNDLINWMYNDLREGTIKRIHINKYNRELMKLVKIKLN